METNFQLLMVSPNLLKSKCPVGGGGGAHGNQFPTFDGESKFANIQSSHFQGGGEGAHGNQFPTFVAESKFAKIQSSHWGEGGSWKPISPTFVAESKFAKIQSSHFRGGGGGVGGTNFQLLMLSLNLLKKNFFGQKCAWEWFWTLSTKWFAYTSYANHN